MLFFNDKTGNQSVAVKVNKGIGEYLRDRQGKQMKVCEKDKESEKLFLREYLGAEEI